jgi:hypothetical protein
MPCRMVWNPLESAPLCAEQRLQSRGDELSEECGPRLANDERAEHCGDQPDAVEQRLGTGKQELKRLGRNGVDEVPAVEDDAERDADHRGDDDVDDPPAEDDVSLLGFGCCCSHVVPFRF